MKNRGMCIWITGSQKIFPGGLRSFGIEPDKIVFIHVQNQKERLWVIEEALKCEGLCAVVGEVSFLDMTSSRRFQLSVEQSKVTGFIIRNESKHPTINACVSRWKVSSLPSRAEGNLPGVGFPRWNIDLLRIRNGKPGRWQMEYSFGKLHPISIPFVITEKEERRKAV
jgi:protein ImuA